MFMTFSIKQKTERLALAVRLNVFSKFFLNLEDESRLHRALKIRIDQLWLFQEMSNSKTRDSFLEAWRNISSRTCRRGFPPQKTSGNSRGECTLKKGIANLTQPCPGDSVKSLNSYPGFPHPVWLILYIPSHSFLLSFSAHCPTSPHHYLPILILMQKLEKSWISVT